MKLFTKDIDRLLFRQFNKGSNLDSQEVVAKIFNPYGHGRWYLLNSDPDDEDYIWAIVQMGNNVEVGSVSRNELESIRVTPFKFKLERDLGFRSVNAGELFRGLQQGKFYKKGGWVENENKEMAENQANEVKHHSEELSDALKNTDHVEAWVVGKMERATTDLSDVTHYLDGESKKMAWGGKMEDGGQTGGIPNNYKGKRTDDIWNMLTENQRVHFLLDHADQIESNLGQSRTEFIDKFLLKSSKSDWNNLDEEVKMAFKSHTMMGQYAEGGMMADGGEVRRFDRHEQMDSDTRGEILDTINDFYLIDGFRSLQNYLYGLFDGYDYSQTDRFKEEMGKLENVDQSLYNRINKIYNKIDSYSFTKMSDGGKTDEVRVFYKKGKWKFVLINEKRSNNFSKWSNKKETLEKWIDDMRKMNPELASEFKIYETEVEEKEGYTYKKKPRGKTYFDSGANSRFVLKKDSNDKMADGGVVKWQDVQRGDNARVKDENKMGVIMHTYGRKFNVRFVDGTEKTYDASELEFFKDEFADGGYMKNGGVSGNDFKVSDKFIVDKKYDLITKYVKSAKKGDIVLIDRPESDLKTTKASDLDIFDEVKRGEIIFKPYRKGKIKSYLNNYDSDQSVIVLKKKEVDDDGGMMAKGGMSKKKVNFSDKVKSIQKSLLKRKKVSPKVQKDYGKTYNKKEALESAKRIAGAMRKKEK